jgi:8-oxo-dGTP pyrophosphatase MutT (NUDIX family)
MGDKHMGVENTKFKASGCLVYSIKTNKFLLIKRSSKVEQPNKWAIVGGNSNPFELPYQTALRELKEETGFNANILLKEHISTYKKETFTYETYLIAIRNEFIPVLNEESSAFKWVTLEELYESRFSKDSHFGLIYTLKVDFDRILAILATIKENV